MWRKSQGELMSKNVHLMGMKSDVMWSVEPAEPLPHHLIGQAADRGGICAEEGAGSGGEEGG